MIKSALALEKRIENLSIVDVGLELLGDKVQKRPISPDYRGLCPFHVEKNPSFYLKVNWNKYVCFGCHASGIPINFPIAYLGNEEGLTYLEKKLDFNRNNVFEMVVFKWHTYLAYIKDDMFSVVLGWDFLEEFEPVQDFHEIETGLRRFHLETLYKAIKRQDMDYIDWINNIIKADNQHSSEEIERINQEIDIIRFEEMEQKEK